MPILNSDDFNNRLKALIGDRDDDETLGILQDINDTVTDLRKSSNEDWKAKYEENDKAWRTKYKEAFFSSEPVPVEDVGSPSEPKKRKFEDLFK